MGWKIPLAWLQVSREKNRLLIAMAGIAFADILMFMQLGFRSALYESNTRLHQSLRADLVLVSPQARNIVDISTFPRTRLYQAMSFEGVESADAFYTQHSPSWRVPETRHNSPILVLAFDPTKSIFNLPEVNQNLNKIKLLDTFLFDRGSRGEYSSTITEIDRGKTVFTEIERHKIEVSGLFNVGASFASDGHLITSDTNFFRIFPRRQASQVSAGLITLKHGIDPNKMAAILNANLPNDVKVLTKLEFVEFEKNYWAQSTPIGFIFSLGTGIGFIVGIVIVYQILYSDVSEHLSEYATLKAMGYTNTYLLGVVFQEALILAILGYLPGCAISACLYFLTKNATNLPLVMTVFRSFLVLGLTIVMCLISGMITIRKLSAADPADIF